MRTHLSLAPLAAIALTCSLQATTAQAQRVFVAATGSDANPCSFASPCRSFQRAHDVAPANGEIDVLDPAGYGALTISKAISIQGHGFSGITVASGATGITINAPSTATVTLNGLLIDGAGAGQNGIVLNTSKSLVVRSCVVANLTNNGIALLPTTSSTIEVSQTLVTNNGGHGIFVQPPSGSSPVVIPVFSRVEVYNNAGRGIGLFGDLANGATIRAIAIDSVVASNGSGGIFATGGIAATSLFVFRSMTFRNGNSLGTGIRAEGSAFINVSQSNLEEDGWSGTFVQSYGDNYTAGSPVPSGETIGKN